jgi:hypothetical protein
VALKPSIGDLAITKLKKRFALVRQKLEEKHAGQKPFGQEPMSKDEIMAGFNERPLEERLQILDQLKGRQK